MVRWFDPRLLLRTLVQLLVARVFAVYADRRERDAGQPLDGPYRYDDVDSLWLDYVADLGDGWNSTATVAGVLAERQLQVDGECLPHGRVLLMGGDQVYPGASRAEYLSRLESPYYSLKPVSAPDSPRDLFALPGNHDWYDGLASFSRLFLQGRWFAGWRTRQRRSYFVLRLPQRWWLVAVDVQLDNDIDTPQLEYLLHATRDIGAGDSVLLLVAVPYWLEEGDSPLRRNIAFLQRRLVEERGAQVRLSLAGDLHHYQRHAGADGRQCVVAGGGGAFTHGTAWQPALAIQADGGKLRRAAEFPSATASRLALWRLLFFPLLNPSFALFLGGLLALLLWGADAASHGIFGGAVQGGVLPGLFALVETLPASPFLSAALLAWFGGLVAFETPPAHWPARRQRVVRWLAGTAHAALQLWLAVWLAVDWMPRAVDGPFVFFLAWLQMLLVLSAASGLLFGAWLLVGYQLAGLHRQNAFSACRLEDWKNFLRLHVAADGTLTVHAIGIPRVCRRWRMVPAPQHRAGAPWVEPADGVALAARAVRVDKVVVSPASAGNGQSGA